MGRRIVDQSERVVRRSECDLKMKALVGTDRISKCVPDLECRINFPLLRPKKRLLLSLRYELLYANLINEEAEEMV